jgi:NAD(P)-dependent dehydrogenase (short-subunit alcohol dehydrogenase family)
MINKRVWFITGASKGLGYAFTCAALKAGDKVVAVARTIDKLETLKDAYQETLLPLNLDVTDREAVFSTFKAAIEHFGRLDIVVNNAGIMTLGMIEELSEMEARQMMDTNFFGTLWVCQAVMPYLRAQRSGHIIQITSIGAIISGPMSGIYSASKFALEGMSEALAKEAEHFGVKLTMVEPGGYWTDLYLSMS